MPLQLAKLAHRPVTGGNFDGKYDRCGEVRVLVVIPSLGKQVHRHPVCINGVRSVQVL